MNTLEDVYGNIHEDISRPGNPNAQYKITKRGKIMSSKQLRKDLIASYKNILIYLGADIEDELADFEQKLDLLLEQVAKEQRSLCYESHWDMSCSYPEAQFEEDNIRDAIKDAPEPKYK